MAAAFAAANPISNHTYIFSKRGIPFFPSINLNCGCEGKAGQSCGEGLDCKNLITLGFYSDPHCTQDEIKKDFVGTEVGGTHCAVCNPRSIPRPNNLKDDTVYIKTLGGGTVVEATIAKSDACDASAPPGAVALLKGGNDACVQVTGLQDDFSVEVWGLGGALAGPTCKRSVLDTNETLQRRGGNCKSFNEVDSKRTETEGRPVSEIVDCTGQNQPCPISKATTDSISFDVSYSADGGVAPGNMGFGVSVSHSVTVSEQWTVPAGQRGQMLYYCDAIQHLGTWIDCKGKDVPGSWLEPTNECAAREINIA